MSIESWIIEEREKEDRQRREGERKTGISLPRSPPRSPRDPDAEPSIEGHAEPRQSKGGQVQIVDISPGAENTIDL
jgi:hypothetical protein